MSDNAILAAMRRMGIAKDEMSGHGFRAMARTILDEVKAQPAAPASTSRRDMEPDAFEVVLMFMLQRAEG